MSAKVGKVREPVPMFFNILRKISTSKTLCFKGFTGGDQRRPSNNLKGSQSGIGVRPEWLESIVASSQGK